MNISCKCSQIVFAVQRSDLLCRRLPQIYALHPILFYQRILGKIHLRPNLSNILIYLLITNALQHSTTTFFTTTAGKVTQDHELAITPHIEIGLHNTPPPPPGLFICIRWGNQNPCSPSSWSQSIHCL